MKVLIGLKSLLITSVAALALCHSPAQAALRDFAMAKDPAFGFEELSHWRSNNLDLVEYRLTSQTFQGETWRHLVTIAHPAKPRATSQAILILRGGDLELLSGNKRPGPRTPPDERAILIDLAQRSGLTTVIVEQVPFQPIFQGKLEDEAIAHSLTQYLQTGDDRWPLLAPMVKSVARAMDLVQEVARQRWQQEITGFTVSGASKRGWTTWLTAAVDSRVKALVPIVFDILNIAPQLAHQLKSWGVYSEQIGDYSRNGLPAMLGTPAGQRLLNIIDPYAYRGQLTQPKIVILGTNDRYWPADAASLYFAGLPGPKYLRYLPGSGHEPNDPAAVAEARTALALAAAGVVQLPQVEAAFATEPTGGGKIILTTDRLPKRLTLWTATAPTRDVRGAAWKASPPLKPALTNAANLPPPASGVTAAFVLAEFDVEGLPFAASSPLGIVAADTMRLPLTAPQKAP